MPSKRASSCDLVLATKVTVVGKRLKVKLDNGKTLDLPLTWFPSVNLAPGKVRRKVQIIRPGIGLEWPDISYELGIGGLCRQRGRLRR